MKKYLVCAWIPVPRYTTDSGNVTGKWFEIDTINLKSKSTEKETAIQYARELQKMHPTISVGVVIEEVERNTLPDSEVFGESHK